MDSLDTLIDFYNNSNENDLYREVAGHILKNLDKVPGATIYDMAEFCFSSTSTVSRFAKKLHFANYSDFREEITYALQNYRILNRNTRDMVPAQDSDIVPLYFNFLQNNISNLKDQIHYEDIAKISDRFHASDQILFWGYQNMQVNNLQKSILMSDKDAPLLETLEEKQESVKKIGENCTIYAILPDIRETSPMRTLLNRARKKGAFVITVCSGKNNVYKKFSDLQVTFDGTKTSMDLYLFIIINNLILYDYNNRYLNDEMDERFL